MRLPGDLPLGLVVLSGGLLLFCATAGAQHPAPAAPAPQAQPVPPPDALGRSTPRGTVLGFLLAERKGDDEAGVHYLNTRLKGKDAAELARQLFVVLDRGLPARLAQLSDQPEGALPFPTRPDQDLIGTINGIDGSLDIVVERVDRKEKGLVWLFSTKTLDAVPALFEESTEIPVENIMPRFLVETRIAQIPLFEFLAVASLPLLYLLFSLANWVLSPSAGRVLRRVRHRADLPNPEFLPKPLRLLLMALTIRWTLSKVAFPLLAREFWSGTSTVLTIAASIWLMILCNGLMEGIIRRRLLSHERTGATSILRFGRRTLDLLWLVAGVLAGLHHFGVNLTAAVAGLSVGGIAVALAAQKTLENVIGGTSVILDQVVRVGDRVKVADREGVVEDIGLRSTRIRTVDRSLVSVPNGQMATVILEDVSMRDKFRFNHTLHLRYETSDTTMRAILDGVKIHLAQDPCVEPGSTRVHFMSLSASTLDVAISAYILTGDIVQFLETQQELLLDVMGIVRRAGASMAFPSQTLYLAGSIAPDAADAPTVTVKQPSN